MNRLFAGLKASDVQTFRKLFPIMTERVPVHLRNLCTKSVEDIFECVVNKTSELQSLIT